jgi:hypothetical protein
VPLDECPERQEGVATPTANQSTFQVPFNLMPSLASEPFACWTDLLPVFLSPYAGEQSMVFRPHSMTSALCGMPRPFRTVSSCSIFLHDDRSQCPSLHVRPLP